MSALTCHIRSSSGTLRNFANRLCILKLLPSGASSRAVVTSPKVAAQESKSVMPAASITSGRR